MKRQSILKSTLCLLMALVCNVVWAQAVIFPQEQQPGTAKVETVNDGYTIGNDLFTAKFKLADGKLTFDGCDELGLIAGSEIFKVQLGDGTEIPASAFTLVGNVVTETLIGTSKEVKAARRYHGKQIKATFKHESGLEIEWRAVLRDGSHYLRTEMDILNGGSEGIAMNSIYPMLYTVQNVDGEKAPAVVGNTRGAVIASDKIFAGVETPTAYNMAGEATDLDNFAFKSWTGAESFAWTPEVDDIPQGIKDLSQYGVGAVVGSRGYVIFREAGNTTITLTYTGSNDAGNCKLHILGVDIVSLTGTVLSGDYHYGTTGGNHSGNSYTVDIPEAGAYMVRYFISVKDEPIASKGNITYGFKVAQPELVYDLASTDTPYYTSSSDKNNDNTEATAAVHLNRSVATRALSAATIASGATITDSWENASWTAAQNVPQEILGMGYTKAQVVSVEQSLTMEAAGTLGVTFKWKSGNHRLDLVGVDLVDGEGNVVSGEYNRQAINSSAPANYSVIAGAGTYTLRYFVETKTETVHSSGEISIAHTAVESIDAETSQHDNWTDNLPGFNAWDGELPEGVEFTGTAKLAMDKVYAIGMGVLKVTYDYTGSSHRLYPLGVQVLDLKGNVVAADFRNGATGGSNVEVYNVVVPKAGVYTVRYIVQKFSNDGYASRGNIDLSFKAINSITGAATTSAKWLDTESADVVTIPASIAALTNENGAAITQVKSCGEYFHIKAGKMNVVYKWVSGSGSQRINTVGLEIVDLNGKVVSSDYHWGYTGSNHKNSTYSVKILEEGIYYVRYYAETNTNVLNSDADVTFTLVETKVLGTIGEDETLSDAWIPSDWKTMPADEVPNRVNEVGCSDENARVIEQQITITSAGTLSVEFLYKEGSARLNMVGVDLVDATGNVSVDDYHAGYTGTEKSGNVYKFNVFAPGTYTIRYFADNTEAINSTGNINLKLTVDYTLHLVAPKTTPLTGKWSRVTTLKAGEEWNIGAVVGVIAPGQARRSFLCYSERERAVPWRAVPAYISWYEININRNNAAPGHEHENFTEEQCLPILEEWKKQLYDVYGEAPYAFVWDDGWDTYGEWQFHSGFPQGFTNMDNIGRQMGAGQGAWLGPVGGYGTSGGYRRNYWNSTKTGGMQLSNPLYYEVFVNAVTNLLHGYGYDFRFFKFDGISAQFSSVGPDAGATGNENAEAIIMAEKVLRGIKEDVFLNTTVGTWASPFWFQHTDAIWRQEKDDGTIGNNSNSRENWITYRDRLVYQNYVQNSPLCPINTLMTHGFILTEFGGPAGFSRDWKSELNELRCAFACGSGMVELYNDYKLTNNLVNPATGKAGELWGEIAKCMQWQRKNADVLPDIHWVGGNPWTGAKAEVYGWAAWNGPKAVLTLRNGANDAQTYKFTLREALDIPAYVKTSIVLTKAFEDQLALTGLTEGEAINIDTELTVTLSGSSVYIFDGAHQVDADDEGSEDTTPAVTIPAVIGEQEMGTFYANEAVVIPEGVTAYVATAEPEMMTGGVGSITLTAIKDIVPAKTGVVICGEMGTYTFTGTKEEVKAVEGNLMKGYAGGADYENVTLTDGFTTYVLTVKDGVTGFYKKTASFKVYNHKAYLQVPKAQPASLRIRFGNTTGIEDVEFRIQNSEFTIYDLQGRRVENPTKGIYIVNGKKVVIR